MLAGVPVDRRVFAEIPRLVIGGGLDRMVSLDDTVVLVTAVVAALAACGPATKLTAVWRTPDTIGPRFQKILVVAQAPSPSQRRSVEAALVRIDVLGIERRWQERCRLVGRIDLRAGEVPDVGDRLGPDGEVLVDSDDGPYILEDSNGPVVKPVVKAAVLVELAQQYRFRDGSGAAAVPAHWGHGHVVGAGATSLLAALRKATVA